MDCHIQDLASKNQVFRISSISATRSHVQPIFRTVIKTLWTFFGPTIHGLGEDVTARTEVGGSPRVVVSSAAFHARVRGSFPGLGVLKETKKFLAHPLVKLSIVGRLRDREVACSASDLQGLNFESCVSRAVSSHSSHHPLLYVRKSGLKPDSFYFLGQRYKAVSLLFFFSS